MTSTYTPIIYKKLDEAPPLTAGAAALWRSHRAPSCTECAFHRDEEEGRRCIFGNGPVPAVGMVVGDVPSKEDAALQRPFVGPAGQYLERVITGDTDIDLESLYFTNVVKCRVSRETSDKDKALETASKSCGHYLEDEIAAVQPKVILAMGATAYHFFSKKKGILKQRGQPFRSEKYDCWVVPTVHPTYVTNNPNADVYFLSDMALFKRYLSGQIGDPPIDIVFVNSLEDWKAAEAELWEEPDKILTFDLETRGFYDHDQPGEGYTQVWCAALTRGKRGEKGLRVFLVPLEHPDSPFLANPIEDWQHNWKAEPLNLTIAPEFRPIVEGVVKLVFNNRVSGHNVKYDVRRMRRFALRYGV